MGPINAEAVQAALHGFTGQTVYLHLETTNGAYAAEGTFGPKSIAVCAFIRNTAVRFHRAVVTGNGPYRVGLQMEQGWVYAEGLTDYEIDEQGRLLMAGLDETGRLHIALELSLTPFPA